MNRTLTSGILVAVGVAAAASCAGHSTQPKPVDPVVDAQGFDAAQVPTWSQGDLDFFLHGSMGTEVVPERVLAAFRATYPYLFPGRDLSDFGLIGAPGETPVGLSRGPVKHLGGLSSLGLNCASCHTTEIRPAGGGAPVRVLGSTGHFDAEAFLGAVAVATWRTQDPANMEKYLVSFRDTFFEAGEAQALAAFKRHEFEIAAAIAEDPSGAKGVAPGAFQPIDASRLEVGRDSDVSAAAREHLRLFHNMRAALHIPDAPPTVLPPASGPGRNDAFGLLAAILFNAPSAYSPVKYGILFNTGERPWVHWDGNTRSALGRNVLAALGLGAPLMNGRGQLDMSLVERQTAITQAIAPPAYPWAVDAAAAARGAATYAKSCASCHDVPESDARLHDPSEIGTDPGRAREFDARHAGLFNNFFATVKIDGFSAPTEAPIRSTQKYWAPSLAGAWARSPYLHNGSVRTMDELLTPPVARAKSFHRGSQEYDTTSLGFVDAGPYVLDATTPGNGAGGHAYGTDLDAAARRDLIEYLKTK